MSSDEDWYVLIFEERGIGDTRRRHLVEAVNTGPDLQEARLKAERQCLNWKPEHPMMPQRRRVFRKPGEVWIVEVTGAVTAYFFTVELARFIAEEIAKSPQEEFEAGQFADFE